MPKLGGGRWSAFEVLRRYHEWERGILDPEEVGEWMHAAFRFVDAVLPKYERDAMDAL